MLTRSLRLAHRFVRALTAPPEAVSIGLLITAAFCLATGSWPFQWLWEMML